jgi:hypothetical protein
MTAVPIGLIAGLILAPMILTCIAIAFIAHKYVETVEECLPNCSYVITIKEVYSRAGLLGKIMRGGIIGALLLMPTLSARRGLVDAQEVKSLPKRYKKLFTVPLSIIGALFVLLVALRLAAYLAEAH